MPEDNISKIKERLDIADVLSGYIKIQKAGMNFKARCPFHNEKTPSFYISPERQIWHCFGCQKGGDIFGFVKEIEGVEFKDALRILAQKAGVQLESYELIDDKKDDKEAAYQITELATRFFEKQLRASRTGLQAMKYLKQRGLEERIIDEFRLGFAPNDWEALSRFLKDRGHRESDIINTGLVIKRENKPGFYDRFRSRIIFPIFDLNGRAIGFTGRIFESENSGAMATEAPAKYINTPQTLIYDKSMVLYGLYKAKQNIRQNDKCLLVEGNIDALMSYQAGVTNVVATSGTALTQNHLKILQRYTNNLDFCFDSDQAGAIATRRGVGLALAQNFNVKAISINDSSCKDPADFVQKYGLRWAGLVAESKPIIQFYFDNLRAKVDPVSVEGKKIIIATLAPFIKRLVSRVEKNHWISQLSAYLKTKEDALEADIASAKDDLSVYEIGPIQNVKPQSDISPVQLASTKDEADILSEALLSLVIKNPVIFREELSNMENYGMSPMVVGALSAISEVGFDKFSFAEFIKKFDGDEAMRMEFAYIGSQELWQDFNEEELRNEFKNIIRKIRQRTISAQLTGLEYEMRDAETLGDKEKIKNLIDKFTNLTKELVQINNA
jgi:DNA primase